MVPSTLDMEPSTLDPPQKDRLVKMTEWASMLFPLPGNCRAFVNILGKDTNAPRWARRFIQKLHGGA